ncbi:MAG: lipopolysaccharide biosynthesis protein [Pseudomonadota bacterium]
MADLAASHDIRASACQPKQAGHVETTVPPGDFERISSLRTIVTKLRCKFDPCDEQGLARRNAILAFAVRVASAALLYLMQIMLARWMGTFEYGIYVFVWTWVLVLGGLSPLGLQMIAIRLVPEYGETGQRNLLQRFLVGSRWFAFGVGSAIALIGLAGLWLFEDAVTTVYILPLYLGLICIPIFAVGEIQDGLGRGYAWMGLALVPPYVLRPAIIILGMLAALLLGAPMTAATATVAAIVATWSTALLQMLMLNRRIHRGHDAANCVTTDDHVATAGVSDGMSQQSPGSAHCATAQLERWPHSIRHWLIMSAPIAFITACDLLLQNADVLIISTMMTPEHVGVYFAAAKTMSLIMFVHYAVGSAVANRFSALKARGDEEELQRFVSVSVAWTFWPSVVAGGAILALGQPLLSLFGPEFLAGYPVMLILVGGFLVRAAVGPAEFLLNMLGEQARCALVLGITAVIHIVALTILVPMFGLIGAASATSGSLVLASLLQYAVVRARLGYDIAIWRNLSMT